MDNKDDVRPLQNQNQRPQSLLEVGSIGLLSNTSEDSIELPPPYATNEGRQDNAVKLQEPRRINSDQPERPGMERPGIDRPLSEVVDLASLPVQMGFQSDDAAAEKSTRERVKNRLDPADFSALVNKNSRPTTGEIKTQTGNRVVEFSEPDPTGPTAELSSKLETNRPVEAKLFEFAKMREQLGRSVPSELSNEANLLAELNYRVWRGEYQQARRQIISIENNDFSGSELWELTWLTAEVAIGLRDLSLLQAAERRIKHLQTRPDANDDANRLESIYASYWAAYAALFQSEPDYVTGVAGFRRVMEEIAQQMPQATPWARQRMAWLLLNSQLEMARCIALGPYQSAVASSDQWFLQANATVQELIQAELASPLLRTKVVCKQIECYAEQARFREVPPLMSYLATQEHQYQRPDSVDEVMWLRQLATTATLRCGILAFNHQQTSWAEQWVKQALTKLQTLENQRVSNSATAETIKSDLAIAYWLRGALYQSQRRNDLALQAFDNALKHWPTIDELSVATQYLEQGERMAIMAVAFWEQDQDARAIQLNQDAVLLIQNAVDAGVASQERLEVPIANLAVMTQSSPPLVIQGTETIEPVDATKVAEHLDGSDVTMATVGHLELTEIREQLESPTVASSTSENSSSENSSSENSSSENSSSENSSSEKVGPVRNPETNQQTAATGGRVNPAPLPAKPRRSRLPSRAMIR